MNQFPHSSWRPRELSRQSPKLAPPLLQQSDWLPGWVALPLVQTVSLAGRTGNYTVAMVLDVTT